MGERLIAGDCLVELPKLAAAGERFHCCVTDPPYHLTSIVKRFGATSQADNTQTSERARGRTDAYARASAGFMGKKWDGGDVAFRPELWRAVYDVLLPGAFLLAFGGTRTYHRMVCAVEDAGFEIRDTVAYFHDGGLAGPLAWVFGSGFPKSHNACKSINAMVEQRYGSLRCDCVDAGDGRASGQNPGCGDRAPVRVFEQPGDPATARSENTDLSVNAVSGSDGLRELRQPDQAEIKRLPAFQEAVLQHGLCGGGAETARHGHAAVRTGLEEQASGDQGARQGVSRVQQDSDRERRGAACPPPKTISRGRHKPAKQLGGALRGLSSSDRGDHGAGHILDPDRREPRRIVLDDQCGWPTTMARVCTWCGSPDRAWLKGIEGLGTALKPAFEPIIVTRKPLIGTVADNVSKYGTGAINVDACRVACSDKTPAPVGQFVGSTIGPTGHNGIRDARADSLGRWPANVVHDGSEEVLAAFPASSPQAGSPKVAQGNGGCFGGGAPGRIYPSDDNSAARFFYTAKADKADRADSKHPTVKPVDLMRWLVTLVCPPGGRVLDPFAGSGTTGEACMLAGFDCTMIERDPQHIADIQHRIKRWSGQDTPLFAGPLP